MFRPAKSKFTHALLTLAVALMPLLSGISGGLHMLLVRHAICRTHGEFIHADENCAGQVASTDEASSREANSGRASSGDESATPKFGRDSGRGPQEDEHCQIVLLARASFVSWRTAEGPALILRERFIDVPREYAVPAPAIARILLAPKQSPPV